jgi:hypothetical protein
MRFKVSRMTVLTSGCMSASSRRSALRQEKRKDSSAPVVASTGIVIAVLATIEARRRCGQEHPIQKRFHSIGMTSGQRNAKNAGLKSIRRRFWTRM